MDSLVGENFVAVIQRYGHPFAVFGHELNAVEIEADGEFDVDFDGFEICGFVIVETKSHDKSFLPS